MPRHSRWRKDPLHFPLGSEAQAVIIPLRFLRQPRTDPLHPALQGSQQCPQAPQSTPTSAAPVLRPAAPPVGCRKPPAPRSKQSCRASLTVSRTVESSSGCPRMAFNDLRRILLIPALLRTARPDESVALERRQALKETADHSVVSGSPIGAVLFHTQDVICDVIRYGEGDAVLCNLTRFSRVVGDVNALHVIVLSALVTSGREA